MGLAVGSAPGSAPARVRLRSFWPAAAMAAAWIPLLVLVTRSDFAFQNDYVSATLGQHHLAIHPERAQLLTVGRPIGAALLQLYHHTFDSIGAMVFAHLLGIGLGLLLSLTLYVYLRRALAVERALAAAAAVGVPMLPSVLIGVLWMTTQPPGLLCILYVSLLYAAHATVGRRLPWLRALLLPAWIAAFFLYPPSALFVCALVLARLMFADPGPDGGRALLRTVAMEIAVIAGAMLAYLIFAKLFYDPLMQRFGVAILRTTAEAELVRRYDFHLAGAWEAIGKTLRFLAVSLRLWVIDDRGAATAAFALLAGLGVAAQTRRFASLKARLLVVALTGALPVLAILPVAASGFESFIYRAASGAQACLAILVFRGVGELGRLWVAWRRSRIEPSLAPRIAISAAPPSVAALLAAMVLSAWQISPVIDDKVRELAFVTSTIEAYGRPFGGLPKGTRTEAVLNIADKGRDALPPYYDLALAGRHECCWSFMALAGVDHYVARQAGAGLIPPQAGAGQGAGVLIFDFRRVPPLR
jgi:hypothetical protein